MEQTAAQLHPVDTAIIVAFLILVTAVGYYMSRVASQGVEEYFLGKNKIPWWVLGISTATSNFDMTGTMIIVAMVYDFGYRGFLVELRGGVGLALAFLMVFLGKWLRRSRVMTSAQWMRIRFGTDRAGNAAHILSAVAQSVLSLGMIIYFCVGGGKFLEYFLPWDKDICTLLMVAVGLFYTLMSGLYGVVFTDVIQMIILSFTAIYVAVIGFSVNLSEMLKSNPQSLPKEWMGFTFEIPEAVKGNIDSTLAGVKTQASAAIETIKAGGEATTGGGDLTFWTSVLTKTDNKLAEFAPLMEMFSVFVLFYLFKVTLEGMSGVGGYTDQRFFAARNEREAGYLTLESILISILRWAMVAGLVALGYWLVLTQGAVYPDAVQQISTDSEKILPVVIGTLFPLGIKGFVIAGLIAAAMSTFDSTLNAGASYLVIDIYHSYINPKASSEQLMKASRYATIGLATLGVLLAMLIPNINTIWDFITMGLSAGMFMPLFLRWYWPRLNGLGFAWGTGAGMAAAFLFKMLPAFPLYVTFPSILAISLLVSIVASLMTRPVDEAILIKFYVQVNPFGFWGPYARKALDTGTIDKESRFKRIIENLNDFIAICLAVPFQLTVLLAVMAFVFHDWLKFSGFAMVAALCALGLYFFWFRNLKSLEDCEADEREFGAATAGAVASSGQAAVTE